MPQIVSSTNQSWWRSCIFSIALSLQPNLNVPASLSLPLIDFNTEKIHLFSLHMGISDKPSLSTRGVLLSLCLIHHTKVLQWRRTEMVHLKEHYKRLLTKTCRAEHNRTQSFMSPLCVCPKDMTRMVESIDGKFFYKT